MTPAAQLAAISQRVHRMVQEQAEGIRQVLREAGRATGWRCSSRAIGPPSSGSSSRRTSPRRSCRCSRRWPSQELDPPPLLPGLQLYLAAVLAGGRRSAGERIAVVPVPTPVPALDQRCRRSRASAWRGWRT